MYRKFAQFRPRQLVAGSVFIIWFGLVSLPIASLHLRHLVSFPMPDPATTERVQFPVADHWRMIHFLSPDCGCSLNLADHLVERSAIGEASEEVWSTESISMEAEEQLKNGGFGYTIVSEAEAAELGIPGGPWLLIVDPAGKVRYSGGHSTGVDRASLKYQEVELLRRTIAGLENIALPSWGCSIDKEWQRKIDPLGLKY